jgi:tetratricopeptide (TPR) repeat protein
MVVAEWRVARLDEVAEVTDGRQPWRPLRRHLGIRAFGINSWTGHAVGDQILNEHDEGPDGDEELYVVLGGRARFQLDGEEVDAPAGTFVFVRPLVRRTAFAEEPETTIVAVGAVPGQAYEPLDWEEWAPIAPLYAEGRYEEAIERGLEALASAPDAPLLLYNLACCEALAGRKADALDHLARAAELSDRVRSFAGRDDDLASLRDEPAFRELVGSAVA